MSEDKQDLISMLQERWCVCVCVYAGVNVFVGFKCNVLL